MFETDTVKVMLKCLTQNVWDEYCQGDIVKISETGAVMVRLAQLKCLMLNVRDWHCQGNVVKMSQTYTAKM